jgi:hypothetical protein
LISDFRLSIADWRDASLAQPVIDGVVAQNTNWQSAIGNNLGV